MCTVCRRILYIIEDSVIFPLPQTETVKNRNSNLSKENLTERLMTCSLRPKLIPIIHLDIYNLNTLILPLFICQRISYRHIIDIRIECNVTHTRAWCHLYNSIIRGVQLGHGTINPFRTRHLRYHVSLLGYY